MVSWYFYEGENVSFALMQIKTEAQKDLVFYQHNRLAVAVGRKAAFTDFNL